MPCFTHDYLRAKGMARKGDKLRKDMPVLETCDLPQIKICLAAMGQEVFKICDSATAPLVDLKPIQQQIWYDIALSNTVAHGLAATLAWVRERPLYVTDDNRILDGHHGWLSGMLIRPTTIVPLYRLKMPLEEALPFLLRFSDAQGRLRNG
jgi:hypothetical protein